ncbi:WXG100 family type VII secretion target [Mycobacterium intracellulare]|uniref:WXG100 family type VII secretion target n=1 Tax=Mycobacterium intracellulare TaxID=1767 RepID=UPI0015CE36DF|nr:hypothetical protein [Mycobacterium intracellulare]
MGQLTPNDVKRWDLGAIQKVFETANGRANTLQQLGENLQQVHNVLSGWQGEAGEAFRADLGKARRDIEADGQESRQVAAAVARAEGDVRACKRELEDIERAAEANGWTITPDWRIDVGDTWIGRDPIEFAAQQQLLQDQLIALNVHAHSADHELATAVRFAVGEVPLDTGGHAPSGGAPPQGPPNPAAGRKPRTWQDMLLPDGPADAGPDGASPKGPPDPAGAVGPPRSLQDMLLPAGPATAGTDGASPKGPSVPAGAVGKPLSLQDMLLPAGPAGPGRGGVPPPRLNPADVESFKAMARQTMIRDGVPPNQIEARLNDVVSQTQQWIDNGMPNYVPPEPKAPPPPGFSEGFSDRWFATEQGIKNLFGQGGPGAPSVLKSWGQMLKGTAETALNPVGTGLTEIKSAIDSPSLAYYLGGKTSDAATTLPTMLFGGEGAAVVRAGELADIGSGVLDPGLAVSPRAPIGIDHPFGYNPWAEQVATDLTYAHLHGEPTAELTQQLADMSTHYVGDNPDRVVLGKFDGYEGGYIGEARAHGGIYFDTGGPTWEALTVGLRDADATALAWQANENFLRSRMEQGVPCIEYVLGDEYSSVEEVYLKRQGSFSAMEIEFLTENAAKYGYHRVGNTWLKD